MRREVYPAIQAALDEENASLPADQQLAALPTYAPVDFDNPTDDEFEVLIQVSHLLNRAFAHVNCTCSGQRSTTGELLIERDPYWGGDLVELIATSAPHLVSIGDNPPALQSVKLDSLRVEVDEYNQICVWIYTED